MPNDGTKSRGIPIMYRKRGRNASPIENSDDWHDWPMEGGESGMPEGGKAGQSGDSEPASEQQLEMFVNRAPVPVRRETGMASPIIGAADRPLPRRRRAR